MDEDDVTRPAGTPESTVPAAPTYAPGRWVVLLPGDPMTILNADTGTTYTAVDLLVDLLRRPSGWSLADLRDDGIELAAGHLATLIGTGLVEQRQPAPADVLDAIGLALLRSASLDARADPIPPRHDALARQGSAPITLPEPGAVTMSLEDALAVRKSRRAFDGSPLPLHLLSTMLHHAARRRSGHGPVSYPYASAGARDELDVVVVATRVADLPPGPYRYDPVRHALDAIPTVLPPPDHASTLAAATGNTLVGEPAASLMLVCSVGALTTRYGRRGVTLAHADAGALLQTLYLVAAALDLAACAIGGARQREDCAWLGLDPSTTFPLGYFVLGPRAR